MAPRIGPLAPRRPARPRGALLGLAIGVGLAAAATTPAGAASLPECTYEEVFQSGVLRCIRQRELDQAVIDLEAAADCRPERDVGTKVSLGLVDTAYLPHFWLALAYVRSDRLERAVGPYLLWRCPATEEEKKGRDEASRPSVADELDERIRDRARSRRPHRFTDYSEGHNAFERAEWASAVTSFCKALTAWDEDRTRIKVQGRWPEPYLPRTRLGETLLQMNCRQAAVALLRRSSSVRCVADLGGAIDPDRQELLELLAEARQKLAKREPEPEECRRFECCLRVWEDDRSCPQP